MLKEDGKNWIILIVVTFLIGSALVYASSGFSVPVNNHSIPLPKKQVEPEMLETDFELTKDGKNDTSDWKTYRNEESGFEFKHPFDLEEGIEQFDIMYHSHSVEDCLASKDPEKGFCDYKKLSTTSIEALFYRSPL